MANSTDDSMTPPSLHEESDVIELTEETYDAGVGDLDDLDFDIPEFKVPGARAPDSTLDEEFVIEEATQRLDASNLDIKLRPEDEEPAGPARGDFVEFEDKPDGEPSHTRGDGAEEPPDDELDALLSDDLTQEDVDDIIDTSTTQELPPTRLDARTDDLADALAASGDGDQEPEPEEGGDDEDDFDRQQMVRTIQMQAVDRSQIERAMAVERLNLSEDILDHRYAPDVIVTPPRVLTKKWREGSPVKPAARPPQITGQAPKIPTRPESGAQSAAPAAPAPAAATAPANAPATSRAPSGQQPRAAQPQAAPKPAAKPADPGGEMNGLVAELIEENKPKKEQRPRVETVKQKKLGPRDVWFQNVFNEEFFRTIPPGLETQTRREVDFIIKSLSLEQGARILDLACGFGRHSIEITQRGYELAGLDLSMVMLKRALAAAQRQSLSIKFIHGDMRKLNFEQIFDGCYLWQSSFGYFDDKTNFGVLKGVWRALKPGGRFLLEVLNRDHIVQQMPARSWWEGKDCIFLEEVDFEPAASVLHTKRSFIYEDGTPPLEQNSFIRLYSLHELTNLLHGAGFRVLEISGEIHHRGRFLGPQNSRLIVLAERK